MKAEIKSPDRIELTPESHLEHAIAISGTWAVAHEKPKPLEMNVDKLVLTRTPNECDEGTR